MKAYMLRESRDHRGIQKLDEIGRRAQSVLINDYRLSKDETTESTIHDIVHTFTPMVSAGKSQQ